MHWENLLLGENSFFSIGLGIRGSEMFAEMDLKAIKPYQTLIKEVGQRHCIDPALIAAIISRESHGGAVLREGWDHRGLKFGLMQVFSQRLSTSHLILLCRSPTQLESLCSTSGPPGPPVFLHRCFSVACSGFL